MARPSPLTSNRPPRANKGEVFLKMRHPWDRMGFRPRGGFGASMLPPWIMVGLVCATGLVMGCGTSPQITIRDDDVARIRTVAILPLVDAPGAEAGYSGKAVAGVLCQELMAVPGIRVVERERLSTVISEQRLGHSDLADPKTAVRLGRLIGADAVMTGSVTQYDSSSIPIFLGLFTHYADVYNVGAAVRMISVETGEACFSGRCSQSGASYEEAAGKCVRMLVAPLTQCRARLGVVDPTQSVAKDESATPCPD